MNKINEDEKVKKRVPSAISLYIVKKTTTTTFLNCSSIKKPVTEEPFCGSTANSNISHDSFYLNNRTVNLQSPTDGSQELSS